MSSVINEIKDRMFPYASVNANFRKPDTFNILKVLLKETNGLFGLAAEGCHIVASSMLGLVYAQPPQFFRRFSSYMRYLSFKPSQFYIPLIYTFQKGRSKL